MPLTNQPYLPLFTKDWLTNNKLKLCSVGAHGVLINVMCVLHKEANYGVLLLNQKFKQNESNISNFALMLSRMLPFSQSEIEPYLTELVNENVLQLTDTSLTCLRMVKDSELSVIRAKSGKKGGKNRGTFAKAKTQANAVNESVYETVIKKEVRDEKKFVPPTLDEMKIYFKENGFLESVAVRAWRGYDAANWLDSKGKKIKNWKQKCQHVWFDENNRDKLPATATVDRAELLKKRDMGVL